MRFDWDYTWSALMALCLLVSVQSWEPKYQIFGYVCVGMIILRANVTSITKAIEGKK